MDYLFYLFVILFFIAVTLLIEGALLWWSTTRGPAAQRIAKRIRVMSAGSGKIELGEDISILKKRLLSDVPALARLLLQVPRVHKLDRLLEQSGLEWTVSRFIAISAAAGLTVFVIAWRLPLLLHLAATAMALAAPYLWVMRKRLQRLIKIESQLPDALDLISRALRAGHAFPGALKMVGEEMPEPIAGEFQAAFDEVNYGVAMQTALSNLAVRVPSMDLRYFVIAVLIQRETGGNLSELLDNIAGIIRDRLQLIGKVRVLSAEGRLSAWVLGLLPFATAGLIQLVNPTFLAVLWQDAAGLKMIGVAAVMMIAGFLWMRKIIHIHI